MCTPRRRQRPSQNPALTANAQPNGTTEDPSASLLSTPVVPPPPPPPEGEEAFVRIELDDDDSEDDPDFSADFVPADFEDDHEQPEDTTASPNRSHQTPNETASRKVLAGNQPAIPQDLVDDNDNPRFEVESLESDDDNDDPFEDDEHAEQLDDDQSDDARVPQMLPPLNFSDDEDDPDFVLENVDGEKNDGEKNEGEQEEPEEWGAHESTQNREYVRFLMSLVEEDNIAQQQRESIANEATSQAATASENPAAQNVFDAQGEDDDDFNYLKESAMVQDDPLEYRDDLHVSRKEVAQLILGTSETMLRRQTRTSSIKRPRAEPLKKARVSKASEVRTPAPLLPLPALLQPPVVSSILPAPPQGQAVPKRQAAIAPRPPQGAISHSQGGQASQLMQPVIYPQARPFFGLMPGQVQMFQHQMSVHIQLLTHFHASVMKQRRTQEKESMLGDHETDPSEAQSASIKSEKLMRRLVKNKRISGAYHDMLGSHVSRLQSFAQRLLHPRDQQMFSHRATRTSIYDLPVIDVLDTFLHTCQRAKPADLPGIALKPIEPYMRNDLTLSLRSRPTRHHYNSSSTPEGWYEWTLPDDQLLAMTIVKYGREFGEYSRDLLPHRLEDDCQARVRYLTSRRCGDNVVKRQVSFITTPLSKDELKLVEEGLKRYGGKTDDPEVWKQIQRNILPSREWSHLQKLWLWRETRRRYKANYRAKLSKRKAAGQAATAR